MGQLPDERPCPRTSSNRRTGRGAAAQQPAPAPLPGPVLAETLCPTQHASSCLTLPPPLAAPLQEAKKLLEEKFKTGKNRWFFSKLRF
jgi:hypothetical protein